MVGVISALVFAVVCFGGSVLSARGAFASQEELLSMSQVIGTKNPVFARFVCWIGLVVFTATGLGIIVLFSIPLWHSN
jgi:hypothetical protein